jgi:hypothetical protein
VPANLTFTQSPMLGQAEGIPATAIPGATPATPPSPAPMAAVGAPAPATYAFQVQPGMTAPAAQFGAPVPVAEASPAAEAVAEGEDEVGDAAG